MASAEIEISVVEVVVDPSTTDPPEENKAAGKSKAKKAKAAKEPKEKKPAGLRKPKSPSTHPSFLEVLMFLYRPYSLGI